MPHDSHLFLGIDVGTGGVRALALSGTGEVVGRSSVPLDEAILSPREGRHEQPPGAWWEAVGAATSRLVNDLQHAGASPQQLAAVAVDGTSGTLVALDRAGDPLRPAMMYNDPRAAAEAEQLNRLAGPFCEKLGYRFKSSFALAKIVWLRNHEPAVFAKTARFVHQADYVAGRLTGTPGVSDYSNALKTGYDLVDECWPGWIDDLPGLRERLPRVVAPGSRLGLVSDRAAAATGLPQGLPVVAGATDGTAACLASGLRRPGDYNTTLGTTLVFKGLSHQICRHPEGLIYCHKLPGGLWLPGAASNTGGEWIGTHFNGADLPAMDAAAGRRLPVECVAYPLVRTGERFPFLSETAQGFFLPEPADPVDRYAACLQGVAFLERRAYDCLERVAGTSGGAVFSTGGGSRSDVWMQCRADVTGRPLHRPDCPESAFGTALLAAAGSLPGGLAETIETMVRVEKTFTPDAGRAEHYHRLYRRFGDELEKRGYR